MATLSANPRIVVIDNRANPPESSGDTEIKYTKHPAEELWHQRNGSQWERVTMSGKPEDLEDQQTRGSWVQSLRPGETYRVLIAKADFSLADGFDPNVLEGEVFGAAVEKFCDAVGVLKFPDESDLIIAIKGEELAIGGTWAELSFNTRTPTHLVFAGASRTAPDQTGDVPRLVDPDAVLPHPMQAFVRPALSHRPIPLLPLVPGQFYNCLAMVVDGAGNWDVYHDHFMTLRRKMVVQIPRFTISNDGDDDGRQDANFHFHVKAGNEMRNTSLLDALMTPSFEITDGRTVDLKYAFMDDYFMAVDPDMCNVYVWSRGVSHGDWITLSQQAMTPFPHRLNFPAGRGENIKGVTETVECTPGTSGSAFRYQFEVVYTVEYRDKP